jgi:5-methylcytosine-specific restriction protein A
MPTAPLHPCACSPTCPVLLPPGVSRCHSGAVQQEQQRPNYAFRRWYRTQQWRSVRVQVLYEEPCCQECLRAGHTTPATEVDHIAPHGGDLVRFFDRTNLQGLCAACHARKTRRGL